MECYYHRRQKNKVGIITQRFNKCVMKNNRLTGYARWLTALCGAILFAVLFFPIWQIQLTAPQYPEGLVLLIFANKLGGNVNIINGLNHYIGMKTLHTKDFVEFTILPFIIAFFSLCCFAVVLLKRKKWLILLT